jgi:hypothetical protein
MQWDAVDRLIDQEPGHKPPSNIMLIHLGSNDLTVEGNTMRTFTEEIQCSLLRFNALMPSTKLIWSFILPRLYWHDAPLNSWGKIDKKRKNVNQGIKTFIIDLQGAYINHDYNINVKQA